MLRILGKSLGQDRATTNILTDFPQYLTDPTGLHAFADRIENLKNRQTGAQEDNQLLIKGKKGPTAHPAGAETPAEQETKTPLLDTEYVKTLFLQVFAKMISAGCLEFLFENAAVGCSNFTEKGWHGVELYHTRQQS